MGVIAALFVEKNGIYYGLPSVDPWDAERDARNYDGPYPVVAHPPCQLWGRFAKVNYTRWGGDHNKPGNDKGCFASALNSVRTYGGVLEHPAFSDAWPQFDLPRPLKNGFWYSEHAREYVVEVWQSVYGHQARKRTWLFYCGKKPTNDLRWEMRDGTHQIGGHDQRGKERNKRTVSGKAASATPIDFRDALIGLAINSTPTKEPAR